MPDYAHNETDKILSSAEKRIRETYQQAAEEVSAKLDDYLRRFKLKDKKWREWVERGVKTPEQYKKWRKGQIIAGKRWAALRQELALKFHETNEAASDIAGHARAQAYALNMNYGTYTVELQGGIDTNFILYDADTVERIFREDPELLPPPGKKVSKRIAEGLDIRWNRQQVQSVALQSILQGEAIPKIAKRLADEVGDKNYKAAIRNARTMVTGAQNAGRVDSYKRAQTMGIHMRQKWLATLDMRTRHQHRMLDGETVEVGNPFIVDGHKIRYPGDPDAPGYLIYNCRCTVVGELVGFEIDSTAYRKDPNIEGMTYEEWKANRTEKTNRITLPAEKAESIKASYIREYRTL